MSSSSTESATSIDMSSVDVRQHADSNAIRLSDLPKEVADELASLDETGDGLIDEQELLHVVRAHKMREQGWRKSKRRYKRIIPLGLIALVGVVAAVFGIAYGAAEANKEMATGSSAIESDADADPTAAIAFSKHDGQIIKTQSIPLLYEHPIEELTEENMAEEEAEVARMMREMTLEDVYSKVHMRMYHKERRHDSADERRREASQTFEPEYKVQYNRAKTAFADSKLNPNSIVSLVSDIKSVETGDVLVEDMIIDIRVKSRTKDSSHFSILAEDVNNVIGSDVLIFCIKITETCLAGVPVANSRRRGAYCDLSGHVSSYEQKSFCRLLGDENSCESDGGCYWVNRAGGYCWVTCADKTNRGACESAFGSQSTGPLCYWKENDCFSGDSTVTLESGEHKAVSAVQPGDIVQVSADVFAPVSFIDAAKPNASTAMEVAILADGSHIASTESHGWMVDGQLKAMADLAVGDAMVKADGSTSLVVRKTFEERKGLFSPVTSTGTIVVDGVLASCYAPPSGVSQAVAHFAVGPLRAIAHFSPDLAQSVSRGLVSWLGDVKSQPASEQNVLEATFLAGLLSASKLTK